MNAIQALSLRKPDAARNGPMSSTLSEVGSRFNKKSNIKEILVRNFFRKYPLSNGITDIQQLQIERQVAAEMETFVSQTQQINSKNLNDFETRLASNVSLTRRQDITTPLNRNSIVGRNPKTGSMVTRKGMLSPGAGAGATADTVRKNSVRGSYRNKQAIGNGSQRFQLPNINSHASLGINNRSVDLAKGMSNNRRSQIVTGATQQNESNIVYGGKSNINSYGQVGLTKLRTSSNTGHQVSSRRLGGGNTIDVVEQRSTSGMRTMSMASRGQNMHPQTTKMEVANAVRSGAQKGSGSLMDNIENILGERQQMSNNKTSNPVGSTRSTKLSGVNKPRRIPGNNKVVEVENLPSDISDDEWGEIQKFGQKLHEEQVRRQRAEHENRVKQVRDVLDQQVKLRSELRQKTENERQEFDKRILEQAKKEMDQERKQKMDLQAKVIEQKRMRDVMLKESKQKQVDDELDRQQEEKRRVTKLAAEIEEERRTKISKKIQEREAAMKVIKENMNEKRKRVAEIDAIKRADAEQVEKNMRVALEKEKAREDAMAERGRRIQAVMDSMGDVIKDNDKALRLKQEKEYIQQCIEKDEQAHLQDIDTKHKKRAKHQQLNEMLAAQVREKHMREENEARANKSYMHRWVERAEVDNKQRTEKEQQRKKQMLANQEFLKDQLAQQQVVGSGSTSAVGGGQGSDIKNKRKYALGGMMNPEEAKMNRALLQEIALVKRGGDSQNVERLAKNPI